MSRYIVSGTNTRVPEEEKLMVINIDSTEQSRARLQLQPTPRCAGSASLDPEAAISASPDLWGQAPPHPTLRPRAPPRQTPWVRAPSRPTETHTAANHSRSKRMGLGQSSNAREETSTP